MCLGVPGRIEEIGHETGLRMATVDFGGVRRRVCLEYTPEAPVGGYVIVHVGFAITEVDEDEAHRTLDVLRAMSDAVEQELGEPLPPADRPRSGPVQPIGGTPGPRDAAPGSRSRTGGKEA